MSIISLTTRFGVKHLLLITLALLTLSVCAGIVLISSPPPIPEVTLLDDPESYERVRAALLEGKNVELKSKAVVPDGSGRVLVDKKTGKPKLVKRKFVSYGRLPDYLKRRLETVFLDQKKDRLRELEKFGEPADNSVELLKWHEMSYNLAEIEALLDMLITDQGFISQQSVEMFGYKSYTQSLPPGVSIDEETGLAVDPKTTDPSKSGKTFLRLGTSKEGGGPVAIFLFREEWYSQLVYHANEISQLRRESSIARVIAFNSHNYSERKRRYEAYQKLFKEYKARKGKTPEIRDEYFRKFRKLVPKGVAVNPRRHYTAVQKRGWK